MKQVRVTIAELEKSKTGNVWALNVSRGSSRSIICLSVPRPNGSGNDSVTVPSTFVPINLTDQVPRAQLLQSSDFRRAVSTGYLRLVSDTDAEEMLSQPGVQEELLRLAAENRALADSSAHLTTGAEAPAAAEASTLSPRVQQFLVSMESADNVVSVLNTVRSMGELMENEYQAIAAAASNKRGFDQLVSYCEQQIELLN